MLDANILKILHRYLVFVVSFMHCFFLTIKSRKTSVWMPSVSNFPICVVPRGYKFLVCIIERGYGTTLKADALGGEQRIKSRTVVAALSSLRL